MSVEAIERQRAIRAELDAEGRVRVSDLASVLGVSEMTVRRDLDSLADAGLIQRVRGGAVAVGPQPQETRYHQQSEAKDVVAQKLAELIGEGGAVGLDASTTVARITNKLGGITDLRVLTNSIETFCALDGLPGVMPLLTGGAMDRRTGSLVGPMAVRSAQEVFLRRFFMSAAGVDADVGTSEATLEEAEVKVAMASVAQQVVLAVDRTKLGQRGMARGLPLDRISILVTDLDPRDPRLDDFREHCEIR